MASRSPFSGGPTLRGFGGFGSFGPPPRDVLILLGVVFVTFSMQFFAATAAVVGLLRLTPAVWQSGFLWQLVTYPFAGYGAPSLWFLLEMLILFWFGRDMRVQLGKRRFWRLLVLGALAAAVVAVAVQLAMGSLFGEGLYPAFGLMQGQRMLLVILVAAFATINRDASILLFFVLPIRAAWFLWIEILFAFLGFLSTKDFAGFLGIVTAVAVTFLSLSRGGARGSLRQGRLKMERWWAERRLARLRRKRGLRVVDGERGIRKDPRIH